MITESPITPITPSEFGKAVQFTMRDEHNGYEAWVGTIKFAAGLRVAHHCRPDRRNMDSTIANNLRAALRRRVYDFPRNEIMESLDDILTETRFYPSEKFHAAVSKIRHLAGYVEPKNPS